MSARCRSLGVAATLAAALPPLQAAAVRYMLRRSTRRLGAGDVGPLFSGYANDVRFVFPGQSSWAGDYRGREEVEQWVRRFVHVGLQLEPDEILVNGPPWRTRICMHFTDSLTAPDGQLVYENRGTIFGRAAWGKLTYYEVNEDTQKVAALDEYLALREEPALRAQPAGDR